MILAAKDDGFIRANADMGYPHEYLARILNVPLELLESTIKKCIEVGKLEALENGIYYVKNWETYSLSQRHKKRLMSQNDDNMTLFDDPRLMYKSKSLSKSKEGGAGGDIEKEFKDFWKAYPPDKGDNGEARKAFFKLRETESLETIILAYDGYMDYLKDKRIKEHFEQQPMYASTFLHKNKWKRFLTYKSKPPL
jgi:hypothetical protein